MCEPLTLKVPPLSVTVAAELLASPQLMVVPAKSAALAPGLASVKVATVTRPVLAPSVAVTPAPLVALKAASSTVAASVALAVAPPSSTTDAVAVYAPSSAYVCVPVTLKVSVLRRAGAAVAGLASPQLMVVPAKSAALAAGLASVKVATVTVALRLPSVAVNPAPLLAVSAASLTVAASVALAVAPPSSTTDAVAVYAPSSAYVCVPVTLKVPLLSVTVAVVAGLPSPQLMVVPAKSAALAPGLASLKVATVTVALRLPSVAVNPAPLLVVSAASLTVAASVALAVAPPSSTTDAVAVYAPSSAERRVGVARRVPLLS